MNSSWIHLADENTSDFSQDIYRIVGPQTHIYKNIHPSEPYLSKHHHIFMNAMQPGSEWLYHGDIVPDHADNFFSIGPCMRTDGGLQWVGKSPKRLLLFQMLWYEGMSKPGNLESSIAQVHQKISILLQKKSSIGCRIHPDTIDTVGSMLSNLGVNFEHSMECIFREPKKTDRSWYRIEFITETDRTELFNLVIIHQIKNTELSQYILDGGGSLERMLMVREGVDSGDKTSIFPFAWKIYNLWNPEEWTDIKRRIVNLIRWIAYLKINHLATSQHSQHTSIHKTLSTLYRMLYIALYGLLGHVDIEETLRWFEKEIRYITGSTRDLYDLREKMKDIETQKNKIIEAFRQLGPSSLQKIANRYCGWCPILPSLILKKELI